MNPEEKKFSTPVEQGQNPIKSLRTYQGDVEEAISKNKYSTSSIMIAEQKRKERNPQSPEELKKSAVRNKSFIIAGGILFLLGIVTVAVVYYIKSNEQVAMMQQSKTLMSFSKELDLSVASSTREQLVSRIVSEKQAFKLPPNSILYINIVNDSGPSSSVDDALVLV